MRDCTTNPYASIVLYASDMVIWAHIDAAYIVTSKARNRTAGFVYIGTHEEIKQIRLAIGNDWYWGRRDVFQKQSSEYF